VNSYPNNKLAPQENSTTVTSSPIEPPLLSRAIGERKDSTADVYEKKIVRYNDGDKSNQDEDETVRKDEKTCKGEENCNAYRENDVVFLRESNCVSTIKKHTTHQLAEGQLNEKSTSNGNDSEQRYCRRILRTAKGSKAICIGDAELQKH